MIISCPNCKKKFDVDEALIPENGRILQCSSCENKWFFKKTSKDVDEVVKPIKKEIRKKIELNEIPNDTEQIIIEAEKNINKKTNVHKNKTRTDLDPEYILDEIDKLCEELYLTDTNRGNRLFQIILKTFLSPKELILQHRLNKMSFEYIVLEIKKKFKDSIAHPSEMVGVVAAQSIGEPCTQITLNSVEYNTPILLDINGKFQKVKIGEYIDNRIKKSKEENIENHPNDTTLEYIRDDKVKVLAPTEDGNIIWDNVKAITKHPVINEDGSSIETVKSSG